MTAWEQQPDESSAAFGAFVIFRDLGSKRSLDEAARRYHARPECDPNPSQITATKHKGASGRIREWAEKYRWRERARAWDEEVDRQAREAQIEAVRAMHRRHAEQAVEFQTKALERLRGLPLEELDPPNVLRYYVEAVKVERLARGEPETVHEQRQKGQATNDRDLTRLVLSDPRAADLACQLFERIATGPDQSGGTGVARDAEAMEAGPALEPAQPQAP
jgi:hypothetical protein